MSPRKNKKKKTRFEELMKETDEELLKEYYEEQGCSGCPLRGFCGA